MKANERHQLKQNEFATTVQATAEWLGANRDKALMSLLAIAVLSAAVGGYFYWKRHAEDQAGAALGIATAVADSAVVPPSTMPGAKQPPGTFPSETAKLEASVAAFNEVISRYPSSSAATMARLEIGALQMQLGKYEDAAKTYQQAVDAAGKSFYGPMARMGLAQAQAGLGQYDKAISAFTDLAAQRDGALPVDGVLMELARTCLRAGKTQDARAAFKRIVDEFPNSIYGQPARTELQKLG